MTEVVINNFDKAKLNQDFADKLRNEHPVQLLTLIKMHLSFLLELNLNEENDPELVDKTKSKKGWLFHKHKKATVCSSSSKSPEQTLPIITPEMLQQVMTLIEFLLNDENLMQEGIFRKTGSVQRQNELKFLVNQLKPLKLSEYTAHDVASVLKSVLNDLPEPVLSEAYFPAYSQIADICNSKENDEKDRIRTSLQLLFLLLPEENRNILKSLIALLNKASEMEAHNKMNSDTLATLFTPHLVCPRKLSPEVLHQTAATMTRMISFMITHCSTIFLVPDKLATDIRAYFAEQKRRRETPEKVLDESISDSVANTVFTFVDRELTAEAHGQSTTDTALAQLYAYIQGLPESTKKKKLIKQFNKQNGHGTPLLNKPSMSRSIGDSIKKHIFHKTIHKTPKHPSNTPSSSSSSVKITKTPMIHANPSKKILFQSPPPVPSPLIELKPPQPVITPAVISSIISNEPATTSSDIEAVASESAKSETPITTQEQQEDMIDDEDFVESSEDELDDDEDDVEIKQPLIIANQMPFDEMEHKALLPEPSTSKKTFFSKARLVKGLSLGNLKLPFLSPSSSPKMKKSKSSSMLVDIDKDDEKRKLLMKSATESFDSSEESDLYFSMDHTKENWHVDVSNINYFLNQTGMQEQHGVRNSMSPITKSTQRMPKAMQESIMTPRSRKPVMISMFANNSDPKSYQTNISQLLEESEEMCSENVELTTSKESSSGGSSCSIPLNDIAAANDNGLPIVEDESGGYSNAFKEYMFTQGKFLCEPEEQNDSSFTSQSDDFESSSEYQKLEESQDERNATTQEVDIDQIVNQSSSNLSKSLLHVLDGNDVSQISPDKSRKRQLDDSTSKDEDSSPDSLKKPLLDTAENDSTDF